MTNSILAVPNLAASSLAHGAMVMAGASTVTTLDGSVIGGTISGLTAHTWTADATGLYGTTANLAAEWADAYTKMLTGLANTLTPLQRMEGNAEAVIENTAAQHMPAGKLSAFRQDAQREFDAIDAAMRIDQTKLGIDPTLDFNSYTYLQMERTLQSNETLDELAIQGHGLNDAPATKYAGFTETFQNHTDGKTFYVGGGPGSGKLAIASFFDDDVLTHAPFPAVWHNGVLEQVNQNGNLDGTLADAVSAANAVTFDRVFVASDFSTDATATGGVMVVPGAKAAPALPVAGAGQELTLDGSVISTTISGLTAHVWTADATGLFHTATNLAAEWASVYHMALQGMALTPLQHLEANAEAVFENTNASKLSMAKQQAFREDAQREFDAVAAAMQINAKTLGIPADAQFTTHSYLMMERTLQFNEQLEQLAIQGHGLNHAPSPEYGGFTENFQNHTDGTTLYVGGGLDDGKTAIASLFDDVIITHASFPTVMHKGQLTQLNQNGGHEDTIANVVPSANQMMFLRLFTASDFSHPVKAK